MPGATTPHVVANLIRRRLSAAAALLEWREAADGRGEEPARRETLRGGDGGSGNRRVGDRHERIRIGALATGARWQRHHGERKVRRVAVEREQTPLIGRHALLDGGRAARGQRFANAAGAAPGRTRADALQHAVADFEQIEEQRGLFPVGCRAGGDEPINRIASAEARGAAGEMDNVFIYVLGSASNCEQDSHTL